MYLIWSIMKLFTLSQRPTVICLLLIGWLAWLLTASNPPLVTAQEPIEVDMAAATRQLFNTLTPRERVGQLFIVSLKGNDVGPNSDIAQLIQRYRVGGVYISAKNKNFTNSRNTPAQVLALTNALQTFAQTPPPRAVSTVTTPTVSSLLTATVTSTTVITDEFDRYNPVPLFIAVQHEGDGYPNTQIRGGLTDIPNQMALGATWNMNYAEAVGSVVGQELSLIGVNMLFGPALDVLDNPRPNLSGSLGTRTFGGHPYWVAEMGQAYIQGIHQGSQHQILVIAKHFPGFGSSDREINRGMPTILKSLDDLRNTELVPFFRVTDLEQARSPAAITDGLMTAHIRYQGLQGNVPISLDARNLPALLALKEIAPWRQTGGLVVSAPLGSPAALEGIAAGQGTFPARRLVQDALFAGNDLLLLDGFSFENNQANELINIQDALNFFYDQYQRNTNFKAIVDKAVERILQAKIKLYGAELLTVQATQPTDNLTQLANVTLETDQIAQAAVTIVTPGPRPGGNPLAAPPEPDHNILILTDSRLVQDCADCPPFPLIEETALEEIILRLFGPSATDQVSPAQISSFSFSDLKNYMTDQPDNSELGQAMQEADWIIFAMLDVDPETHPQSDAVRVLLRNHYDAIRNKNLVLFAFNAPYFLDETEVSQLTAYYGFYSKGDSYLEVAARLLFQQFEPRGAAPVAIPAIGPLDLSPDPNQIIQLIPVHKVDPQGNVIPLEDNTNQLTKLELEVREGIRFRTNVIVDKNGYPVPDGTKVDFFRLYPLEGLSLEPQTARTEHGVAEMVIFKERDTPLRVTASSNLAVQSIPFDIGPGILDTPTPTPTLTPTPTGTVAPTETPSPTPTPSATSTATPVLTATPMPALGSPVKPVSGVGLVYTIVGALLIGGVGFVLGGERFSLEERVRPALVALAFALVSYSLYAVAGVIGYRAALVELGRENRGVAPLISLICAIVSMGIWFLKPGRIFKLDFLRRKPPRKIMALLDESQTDGQGQKEADKS